MQLPRTLRNFCIPTVIPNDFKRREIRRCLTSLDFENVSVCQSVGDDILVALIGYLDRFEVINGYILSLAKDMGFVLGESAALSGICQKSTQIRFSVRFSDIDQKAGELGREVLKTVKEGAVLVASLDFSVKAGIPMMAQALRENKEDSRASFLLSNAVFLKDRALTFSADFNMNQVQIFARAAAIHGHLLEIARLLNVSVAGCDMQAIGKVS